MKLTRLQRELLAVCKCDASRPPAEVARILKTRERAVRYHLSSLFTHGVARKVPFLNIYPLGFRYVNIYFSLAGGSTRQVEELVHSLVQTGRLSWLAELGGDFHYGAAFMLKRFDDIERILAEIPPRQRALLFEKEYTSHLSLTMYPLKFLSNRKFDFPRLGYWRVQEELSYDELDSEILAAVAQKHLLSAREIAQHLGRAHSTINLRLERLRRAQVFLGHWLQTDLAQLGCQTYKVLVYARGLSEELRPGLEAFVRSHPRVDHFIECIGAWDFEIGLVCDNQQQVTEILRAMYDKFGPLVRLLKVLPIFRMLKWQQFAQAA